MSCAAPASAGDQLIQVGSYTETFNKATGQTLPCGPIFQSAGLKAHIQKRHPNELQNLQYVPAIIASPDYIGRNPKEPDSIELVKTIADHVMVCIKLDASKGYLYVASVFNISSGKLQNRLNSGRLKRC